MSAKRQLGRYHKFTWGGVDVGGILSITGPEIQGAVVDVSDADSGIFSNFEPDRVTATMTIECNYVQDNAGQLQLQADMLTLTSRKKAFSIVPSATAVAGDIGYSGDAILTGVSISRPENNKQTFTATFQITGPITRTVTPT
jgi:ABC-type amino acid transport substrate-binding protein